MFSVVKNYKKLFLLSLKSDFSGLEEVFNQDSSELDESNFESNKSLVDNINIALEDGKITKKEYEQISLQAEKDLNKLTEFTKNELKKFKEQGITVEIEEKKVEQVEQVEKESKQNKLEKIINKNNLSNLSIENGKVYLFHKCPDGKNHRGYFTIENEENSHINSSERLEQWKNNMIKKLEEKYPKIVKEEVKKEIKEEVKNEEDKSIGDKVEDAFDTSVDYVSEKYTKVKEWIKELLKGDEIGEFIGKNGEKINIEFDDKTDKFSMDTPWFDNVGDNEFDLLKFYENIKTPDEAKSKIEEIKSEMKKMYDKKVIDNAMSYIQKEEEISYNGDERDIENKDKSVVISTFEVEGIEKPLKVRLSRKYDIDGKLKGIFVGIDTTFSDGIKDNDVYVKILGEINEDSIDRTVEESIGLYRAGKLKLKVNKKENNWFSKLFSKEK